ncbi:hypothetical protein GQQ22_13420 [Pantoea agglomerans]|uniref:hypothetical protein n=1 Tax=Enterobacter agglomerans TaxID=549 RepID=UPI0013BB45C8|nr:hypothetical protein [Pantoea agglomerans]NEG99720.1 hypothetical protein [Pantoea agglomerans]
MEKDTGGQAFPKQQWEYDGHGNVLPYQEDGMTMRDYFAAKAMQGELASGTASNYLDNIASRSYAIADAMLRARGQ